LFSNLFLRCPPSESKKRSLHIFLLVISPCSGSTPLKEGPPLSLRNITKVKAFGVTLKCKTWRKVDFSYPLGHLIKKKGNEEIFELSQ